MTPSQAKDLPPSITAFANGQAVDVLVNGVWQTLDKPAFNYEPSGYRIKPTAKYRVWTKDEVPLGKIVRDKNGNRYVITAASIFSADISDGSVTYDNLLVNYTMDDGSPCGVLEN